MKKLPIVLLGLVCLAVFITFPFCVKALDSREETGKKSTYSAIIDVWQLDMVEGGKGSRKSFLESYSKSFEKENNVLVNVSIQTKFSAEEKMKNGIFPDVLSYSPGVDLPFERLSVLNCESFGASYNNKNYAVCWGYGGYVIISKKGNNFKGNLYVSQNGYTQPLISYYLSEYRFENMKICTPIDAYTNFLADKNGVLIGTQRDLFRLSKRGIEIDAKILSSFSDIILYASCIDNGNQKKDISKKFVESLSKVSQKDLDSIGMISLNQKGLEIGNSELSVFNGYCPSLRLSAFTKDDDLSELQTFLSDLEKSEEEKLNRIKNIVQ